MNDISTSKQISNYVRKHFNAHKYFYWLNDGLNREKIVGDLRDFLEDFMLFKGAISNLKIVDKTSDYDIDNCVVRIGVNGIWATYQSFEFEVEIGS